MGIILQEGWRRCGDSVQVLRRSASEFLGMEKQVYPLLKFSYDNLPSDKIRSSLFYCSLFPEDFPISKMELIHCWISEGLLDETNSSEIWNQGYYIIGVLVPLWLLEEEAPLYVKVHDVIRDMLLWIACEVFFFFFFDRDSMWSWEGEREFFGSCRCKD